MIRVGLIAALSASAVVGQTFDVASVKPQPWNGQGSVGVFARGDTLHAEHASLNDLVEFAYDLRDDQLSGGPGWGVVVGKLAESELFQVIAKAPASDPPATVDQLRRMLQSLLADRFKLQIHHVSKVLPTYNLVVNKSGSKLRESPAGTQFAMNMSGGGPRSPLRIVAAGATIERLLGQLRIAAGRPVFDQTGLTGSYDFTLEWMQDSASLDGPTIFTALQEQLGLKLEPATAPFDTVVIDHAEKPTAN